MTEDSIKILIERFSNLYNELTIKKHNLEVSYNAGDSEMTKKTLDEILLIISNELDHDVDDDAKTDTINLWIGRVKNDLTDINKRFFLENNLLEDLHILLEKISSSIKLWRFELVLLECSIDEDVKDLREEFLKIAKYID